MTISQSVKEKQPEHSLHVLSFNAAKIEPFIRYSIIFPLVYILQISILRENESEREKAREQPTSHARET